MKQYYTNFLCALICLFCTQLAAQNDIQFSVFAHGNYTVPAVQDLDDPNGFGYDPDVGGYYHGVGIGSYTSTAKAKPGWHAGGRIHVALNTAWSISAGLSYKLIRFKIKHDIDGAKYLHLSALDGTIFGGPQPGGYEDTSTVFEGVILSGDSTIESSQPIAYRVSDPYRTVALSYASIPIMVSYKPAEKLEIGLGGTVDYLIIAKENGLAGQLDYTVDISDGILEFQRKTYEVESVQKDRSKFNPINISLSAYVQYAFAKRWAVRAAFDYGVTDVYNNLYLHGTYDANQVKLHTRQMQVGVVRMLEF